MTNHRFFLEEHKLGTWNYIFHHNFDQRSMDFPSMANKQNFHWNFPMESSPTFNFCSSDKINQTNFNNDYFRPETFPRKYGSLKIRQKLKKTAKIKKKRVEISGN